MINTKVQHIINSYEAPIRDFPLCVGIGYESDTIRFDTSSIFISEVSKILPQYAINTS